MIRSTLSPPPFFPGLGSRLRSSALLVLFVVGASGLAVFAETPTSDSGPEPPTRMEIYLKNGGLLRAEILARKPEKIVVDLGFAVLSVPLSEVARIESLEGNPNPDEFDETEVYRIAASSVESSVDQNVDRCAEAVVEIRTPTSLGSGFVIHPSGYVVTNDHVIAGENELTVTVFREGEVELEKHQFTNIRVVATNPHADLALLKIEGDASFELVTVPLGDSDTLQEGQAVFAIGSPLGFDRTVSEGIVSLRNRPSEGQLYIQTTTQINPGNSGGPLFNLRSEVVGVANMKLSGLGVEGMGFAIPSSTLKSFLKNRDAYAFDPRHPNAGFRYLSPPRSKDSTPTGNQEP